MYMLPLRPGAEAARIARTEDDFATAAKFQHYRFAAGNAIDEVAEDAAAVAGCHGKLVLQRAVPGDNVAVIDDDRAGGRYFQSKERTEAVDDQLPLARGLADEKAAGTGKERSADALHARGELHALARGEVGAVV